LYRQDSSFVEASRALFDLTQELRQESASQKKDICSIQEEIVSLKKEHKEEIVSLKKEHKEEIVSLKKEHKEEIASAIASVKKEHKEEIASLKIVMDSLSEAVSALTFLHKKELK
jgi:hypothetical protein